MVMTAAATAVMASAALVAMTLPLLRQHALAHPTARSSHRVPTPQGAGIGVVIATLAAACAVLAIWMPGAVQNVGLALTAAAALAVVGAFDDFRSIPVAPRMLLQGAAVAVMLLSLPADARLTPFLPLWAGARQSSLFGRPLVREPRQLHG